MSDLPWTLRAAGVTDAAVLANFAAQTFEDAFGADNDPDDLREHLERSFSVAQQTQQIESPDYRTILAWRDSKIEAYCQVRRSDAPDCVHHQAPVELLRFYVDSSAHGQGLAQRLMKEVRSAAEALGGRHVWLSVWENNPRGIAFYTKEGFQDVGSAFFVVGTDRQTDRILVSSIG